MADWREHVAHDSRICSGRICARGTRVLLTNILDSLAEGATREQILGSYPSLTTEHIEAAMAYAAELACEEPLLSVENPVSWLRKKCE